MGSSKMARLPLVVMSLALAFALAPSVLGTASDEKSGAKSNSTAAASSAATSSATPAANADAASSDSTAAPSQPAAAPASSPSLAATPSPMTIPTPTLAPTQDAAPSADADSRNDSSWAPMAATSGNPGLFTLETGGTLPRGGLEFTAGVNKFGRDPGNISVLTAGWGFAAGITNKFSVFAQIDAYNYIHVGAPSLLSLSSATTGFPQYQNTIYRSTLPLPGVPPAYVEDYPFAGHNGGGGGNIDVGFKWNLVSEERGGPLSLSIKNDFYIPTVRSLNALLSNGGQTGTFSYGIGAEISKSMFSHTVVPVLNVEYQYLRDPSFAVSGVQEGVNLADQIHVGAGFLILPRSRIQIISEYNAVIFVGSHTTNTTFGPRDPVDQVTGIRFYFFRNFAIDVGYRYMVDLTNSRDRNGFVLKLDSSRWPRERGGAVGGGVSVSAGNDLITATCSAEKTVVAANSGERIVAHVIASDRQGHPLTYHWIAAAGDLQEAGPSARWNPAGVAAGSYVLTARIDDAAGHSATCAIHISVQ